MLNHISKLRHNNLDIMSNIALDYSEDIKKSIKHIEDTDLNKNWDFKDLSNDELTNVLKSYNIEIDNLNLLTDLEKTGLEANLYGLTKIKINNISNFVNSDENTSYTNSKLNLNKILKGSFNDIYPTISILSKVGWTKNSAVSRNDERSTLNYIMDKKSLQLAKEILGKSPHNQDSNIQPVSGLIASIQALRYIGFNDILIKDLATYYPLREVVYVEYHAKPRTQADATAIIRIISPGIKSGVQGRRETAHKLSTTFGWTI